MDEPETTQDNTSEEEKETSKLIKVAEQKGKSDGLAEAGRLRAENEKLVTSSKKLTTRIDTILRERDEAELETHKDNPAQLSAIRERQTRRTVESNLESMTGERDSLKERIREGDEAEALLKKGETAKEVATRLEVNSKQLIKLAKFSDGSTEEIEDIAKNLPKVNPEDDLNPDSNISSGGSQTEEKIRENYRNNPTNPAFKAAYIEWRRSKGI